MEPPKGVILFEYIRRRRKIEVVDEKQKTNYIRRSMRQEPINLFFKSMDEIIDPYSGGGIPGSAVINPAVIEYLGSRANDFPKRKRLTIDIEYGGILPEDPFLPEKLIKKNLEVSIKTSIKRNFKLTIGSFALALVGIGILAFINKVPFVNRQYAFNELFLVISWVFIWNFVDLFFFERVKVRLRHRRLIQIYLAEYRIKNLSPDKAKNGSSG